MQLLKKVINIIAAFEVTPPKEMFTLDKVVGAVAGSAASFAVGNYTLTLHILVSAGLSMYAGFVAFFVMSELTRGPRRRRAA